MTSQEGDALLRKVPGNWTFVLVTDRQELDDQLYKAFASAEAVTEPEDAVRATSGERLRTLLTEDHRYVFTLIHKFRTERGERHNAGAANVEVFFRELMEFYGELNEEEKRTLSEGLSEEELVIFDLLTKPELQLSQREREQVRNASRDLLTKLKAEALVLDWRQRQQSRAAVRVAIEDVFDKELPDPPFSADLFRQKCELVYHHIFDSYLGNGRSIYTSN